MITTERRAHGGHTTRIRFPSIANARVRTTRPATAKYSSSGSISSDSNSAIGLRRKACYRRWDLRGRNRDLTRVRFPPTGAVPSQVPTESGSNPGAVTRWVQSRAQVQSRAGCSHALRRAESPASAGAASPAPSRAASPASAGAVSPASAGAVYRRSPGLLERAKGARVWHESGLHETKRSTCSGIPKFPRLVADLVIEVESIVGG